MGRLSNKNALVMGASTGIGRAICELYAKEGARVVVVDFGREDEQAQLIDKLRAGGADTLGLQCDVTDRQQVKGTIEAAVGRFGHVDIVVNNAGRSAAPADFASQSWGDWDKVMSVNLQGVAYGMHYALEHMLPRKFGRIINTASQLAHKPAPGNASYCAAKAAVVALSVSVAQEVAAHGITVNCVCPGPTDTPMWRASDERWNEWKLSTLPIKRIGTPEEVAWAYVYLASDEAAYMVGQSVSPNGGDVMW